MFFTNALNAAGAELFMATHVEYLDRSRYDVSICVLHKATGPSVEDKMRALGVRVHDLDERRRPDPRSVLRLAAVLRRERVDVLQSHTAYANLIARLAARLARVPVVTTEQTVSDNLSPGLARLNRWTLPLSAAAVYISKGVRDSFTATRFPPPPARSRVIPNGVDVDEIAKAVFARAEARTALGLASDAVVVGSVGRLEPVKGHVHLVRAFKHVLERVPAARLVLVGGGREERSLRSEVAALGLEDRVIFTGHRSDAPRLLRAFDVFSMPSLHEGLGVAALEAMAAGVPIVASRTGGLPEVVLDGDTGILVPPGEPRPLADALVRVLADAELSRSLSNRGREHVASVYTIQATVAAYDRVYEECVARS